MQQNPATADFDTMRRLDTEIKIQAPRLAVEQQNNINTIIASKGDCVLYGTSIQLLHVQSGQYMILSNKSAEQDKTCQKIELTEKPSASRVAF